MTIKDFGELLAGNNGIKISKELVIYNDFELYNYNTEESKCYNSLDELVNDNADVKKIIEDAEGFYLEFNGGRGASGDGAMGGGFTSAGGGGKHEKDYGKSLYPAELNLDNKNGTSVDHVIDKFKTKYADAKIEYGITVNEQGYATKHIQGGKTSVPINGAKGETLIHNHPSGGNFSKADLQVFSQTQIKSIVATSSNTKNKATYQITKGSKFKAKEFDKAISKAKWPTQMSYDEGASWWLKKNAKTYGYTFKETH